MYVLHVCTPSLGRGIAPRSYTATLAELRPGDWLDHLIAQIVQPGAAAPRARVTARASSYIAQLRFQNTFLVCVLHMYAGGL